METKKIVCPECNLYIEYWTRNNYIECPKCKHAIVVKMSKRKIVLTEGELSKKEGKTLDDLLNEGIIFVDEHWDEEEDSDYWWVYYEDEDCTKEIEDIDEFVKEYNEVLANEIEE